MDLFRITVVYKLKSIPDLIVLICENIIMRTLAHTYSNNEGIISKKLSSPIIPYLFSFAINEWT